MLEAPTSTVQQSVIQMHQTVVCEPHSLFLHHELKSGSSHSNESCVHDVWSLRACSHVKVTNQWTCEQIPQISHKSCQKTTIQLCLTSKVGALCCALWLHGSLKQSLKGSRRPIAMIQEQSFSASSCGAFSCWLDNFSSKVRPVRIS